MGEWWLETLAQVGALRPDSRVLDMGCGPGRIAAPLARYLDGGSYEGFDVTSESIDWARNKISTRYPNFRFELADVRNPQYRPQASTAAAGYRFPYPNAEFDLALALSLFTHMRPEETERYVHEAARTLRRGGRLVSTFFLLTEEAERALAGRESELRLEVELSDAAGRRFRGRNAEVPEHRIAVSESDVRGILDAAGLDLELIRYGGWYAGPPARQDMVVAVRRTGIRASRARGGATGARQPG